MNRDRDSRPLPFGRREAESAHLVDDALDDPEIVQVRSSGVVGPEHETPRRHKNHALRSHLVCRCGARSRYAGPRERDDDTGRNRNEPAGGEGKRHRRTLRRPDRTVKSDELGVGKRPRPRAHGA